MKRARFMFGAALALTSALALAQGAPESLLPPGFDDAPAPRQAPAAAPAARAAPGARPAGAAPAAVAPAQAAPAAVAGESVAADSVPSAKPAGLAALEKMSLEQLEKLTPEELQEALGLETRYDIPPAARRSLRHIGIIDESEGGLSAYWLAGQDASLVRAALAGNKGALVSRWGHILLRRALASRLDAPAGMNPADFAALRAGLLLRMGEGEAARALVQDIDTGNYTPRLAEAAFDAYVATADFTGFCPVAAIHGGMRKDAQWQVAGEICRAYRGEGSNALIQLDRALADKKMAPVDVLLAQKYAGAAGKARRAVKIEWDAVKDMTPWRYALTIAVGLEPPAQLMQSAGPRFDYMAATAPMLGLARRAEASDRAGAVGILSGAAMVDLYSQIYADNSVTGPATKRASLLRDAYVGSDAAERVAAMRQLWEEPQDVAQRYARMVLTAHAAARVPVSADLDDEAADLVKSMLAAGLDANAMRWAGVVDAGSHAWALLALASPGRARPVDTGSIESFLGDDDSEEQRKSAFLVAGLAGLGRITQGTRDELASELAIDFKRQTRWSRLIDAAAKVGNPALVALLAGVGMQGDGWDKMTPRHLFHIVSALRRVGLEAEARMIAAEAVARG